MIERLKEDLKKALLEIEQLKNFITTEEFRDLDATQQSDAFGELEYLEDKVKDLEEEINRMQQQDGYTGRTRDNARGGTISQRLQDAFNEAGLTVEDLGFITETRPESGSVSAEPEYVKNAVNTPEAIKALEEIKSLREHQIEIKQKIEKIHEKIMQDPDIGARP